MADNVASPEQFGPIEFFVLEFSSGKVDGAGFRELLRTVDQGEINVLDLEFFAKEDDGTFHRVEAHDVAGADGVDFALFDGAASGLLLEDDIEQVRVSIEAGSVAAVLVVEYTAMFPVIVAMRGGGARILDEGTILATDLEYALDATDA